jgi:hypothetical protein
MSLSFLWRRSRVTMMMSSPLSNLLSRRRCGKARVVMVSVELERSRKQSEKEGVHMYMGVILVGVEMAKNWSRTQQKERAMMEDGDPP